MFEWRFITRERYSSEFFASILSIKRIFEDLFLKMINVNPLYFGLSLVLIIFLLRGMIKIKYKLLFWYLISLFLLFVSLKYIGKFQQIEVRYVFFIFPYLLYCLDFEYISTRWLKLMGFVSCVLLLSVPFYFSKLRYYIIPLDNDSLNTFLSKYVEDGAINFCSIASTKYDKEHYDFPIFMIKNNYTLRECRSENEKYILVKYDFELKELSELYPNKKFNLIDEFKVNETESKPMAKSFRIYNLEEID